MHLDSVPVRVERNQFIDGAWKSWSNMYPDLEPMNDPVSVLYQFRATLPQNQETLHAFSGKQETALYVRPTERTSFEHSILGPIEVQQYHLFSSHRGTVEQRGNMTMALTTDAARIPVFAQLQSTIGTIRAELTAASNSPCSP